MTDIPVTRDQQLRVFYSLNLSGADDFKHRWPTEEFPRTVSWPARFEELFRDFNTMFRNQVEAARDNDNLGALTPFPQLWKVSDDAMVFVDFVDHDKRARDSSLGTAINTFVELVATFDERYVKESLGMHGCIWTAGFPIRNKAVHLHQENAYVAALDDDLLNERAPDLGSVKPVNVAVTNYIGRDMDLGASLCNVVPSGRVVASLDLVSFLMEIEDRQVATVWHVGWRQLSGVFGDMPYPILLLEKGQSPSPRRPWEGAPVSSYLGPEVKELLSGGEPMTRKDFDGLFARLQSTHRHVIKAYAAPKDMPEIHQNVWWNQGEATEPITIGDTNASPNFVPNITLDDLNRLLMVLQEEPDELEPLREVLLSVGSHPEYDKWLKTAQFTPTLFRLTKDMTFGSSARRRLLERTRLVYDDVLRVKINVREDKVFLTDGLWISPAIRAFPFMDESDLVLKACVERDWPTWATCVIDPAVGAGHNVLRYPGEPGTRRIGFDRNGRATIFASINAALNDQTDARFGIGEIHERDALSDLIPPTFSLVGDERILMLANMPFAPVPQPGSLARSADGGPRGLERTVEALKAFKHLKERHASPNASMRAAVLAYTLGTRVPGEKSPADRAPETWQLVQIAQKLFGDDKVRWHFWGEERLWRIDGIKKYSNPMDLANLEDKAYCRFYVRENADREEVRQNYQTLRRELESEGWDCLGYGAVTIDC